MLQVAVNTCAIAQVDAYNPWPLTIDRNTALMTVCRRVFSCKGGDAALSL